MSATALRRKKRGGFILSVGAAVVALAAVVLCQSAVHWGPNVTDEHLFAWHGWCVAVGARPYVDFWDNKPPGIWWANALGYRLFGEGAAREVAICTAAQLVALTAFAAVALRLFQRALAPFALLTGAVVLSDVRFDCGGNRTETFLVACELLTIAAYLAWHRGRRTRWLLLAGLAGGCAPLFKQSGLAAAAACAIHFIWTVALDKRRSPSAGRARPEQALRVALTGLAGFALPLVAGAAALAAQGALREAHFAVVVFNRASFAVGDASWLRVDRALATYAEECAPLLGVCVAAGVGIALGALRTMRRRVAGAPQPRGRAGLGLILVWLAFAVYLACVGPGRRGHHLTPALPPLALLAVYVLHFAFGRRRPGRAFVARPHVLGVAVVYAMMLGGLAAGNIAAAARAWEQKRAWWALEYASPRAYQAQAARIRSLARPDERIYVWGWSPGTYRYAYRLPASRFATLEKCGQLGAQADFIVEGAVRDVLAAPPAVFVISTGDWRALQADSRRAALVGLLRSQFRAPEHVGGMEIFARTATHP